MNIPKTWRFCSFVFVLSCFFYISSYLSSSFHALFIHNHIYLLEYDSFDFEFLVVVAWSNGLKIWSWLSAAVVAYSHMFEIFLPATWSIYALLIFATFSYLACSFLGTCIEVLNTLEFWSWNVFCFNFYVWNLAWKLCSVWTSLQNSVALELENPISRILLFHNFDVQESI